MYPSDDRGKRTMPQDTKQAVQMFKALCDESRVAIVQLLQTGEKCACHISEALDISQSKLSYHMKILCDSGLVSCWYVGKWTHYQIDEPGCKKALDCLKALTHVQASEPVLCGVCEPLAM